MLLEYSFRKSFLLSNPPLKPDQNPIQQLLPPQIPSSSLVKTYSFSQLGNNNNNSKRNLLQVNNNNSMSNPSGNNSSNIINNESSSFNEPYSEISLQLPTMSKNNMLAFAGNSNKRIQQLQAKNQHLTSELKAQKQITKALKQQIKKLRQDYQSLLKIHNLKQKEMFVKDQRQQFMKKMNDYQQQLSQLKKELGQKNEQLTVYEMRSQESRRLLQKLNQNINKKEAKLVRDKEIVSLQLQRVNSLLQEANDKLRQKDIQLQQLQQKYKHSIQQSLTTSHILSQRERNIIITQYQSKLQQKISQINQLMDRFTAIENQHREEVGRLRECLSQHQSNRTSLSEGMIRLQEDQVGKDQERERLEELVGKMEEENGRLRQEIEHLRQQLQTQSSHHHHQQSSLKSKQTQLQLLLTNTQFLLKQSQHKLTFLEQQNQRINQIINQLKQDKRLLQREKQEMKSQINQKNSIIEQVKARLEQAKEMEVKYKVIIENYEKEQERVYEREQEQASAIAVHEVRVKGQNIEIEKLNLLISQKQSELNNSNLNIQKYKKLYYQQKQMLSMYKQQTAKARKNTQAKWNELKLYYENEIQLLEQKVKELQTSISSTESRTRIRNILQNSDVKAKIVTSRIVTGRQRLGDKQESYINELNMLSTDRENHYRSDVVGAGEKKRGQQLYKVSNEDNDEELKENYWHGLNNDSMEHEDEEINKN